jgi:hypothetical protein
MNASQLIWDNLRLTVEPHGKKWQASVYDMKTFVTLHRTERTNNQSAKVAAVEFAFRYLFGPASRREAERIAERFSWRPLEDATK